MINTISMTCEDIKKDLKKASDPQKALILARFFKTRPGEYGEGDVFIGVKMPDQHQIAKKYIDISLKEAIKLLKSPIHEHRMTSLLILVKKYQKTKNIKEKQEIYKEYIKNKQYINNWDLVDVTTPKIVGDYLYNNPADLGGLRKMLDSNNLWDRRIAVLTTYTFIKNGNFDLILEFAEKSLDDSHDLMHKAVGWMLREMGKIDIEVLRAFLKKHHKTMPRTMLRYAIEKMNANERKKWMAK